MSGAFVHLATEDLDRGPVVSYVTFPIRGEGFDELWREAEGSDVAELQARFGEDLPLLQAIRREGVLRERPLLLETLKAVASGRIRVSGGEVVDESGMPTAPLCLNDEVERAVATADRPPSETRG